MLAFTARGRDDDPSATRHTGRSALVAATAPTSLAALVGVLREGTGAADAQVWLVVPDGLAAQDGTARVATVTDLLLRPDVDHALPVLDDGELRAVLSVGKPGRPVTAADRALIEEIGAGARLLLRVVARGAELRARVARADELAHETEASRRRLGRARELERHRLVAELGGATTERLAGFRAAVDAAAESVDEGLDEPADDPAREEAAEFARHHLTTARERLEELLDRFRVIARGVHPAVLRDQGPRAALEEVVADLPRSVHLTGRLAQRLPVGGRVGAVLRRRGGAGPARDPGGGGAAGAGPRAGRRPRRGPRDRRGRRPRRHPRGPRRRRRPARRPRRVPRAHRRRRRAHGPAGPAAHAAAPPRRGRARRMSTERARVAAFWVVFVAVTALTLVWLTVGALVTTPLNEPPGQAVVDYLASAVNLVVAVVLLRFGGRSWSGRLLALAMVGSAGAFNLQAHAATMAVLETTGIQIGEAHQILLHGVAGAAFAGALLLVPVEIAGIPMRRRVVPVVAGLVLFAAGVGTALLPHTVSCVVFFGFLVPLLGVGANAPAVRRAPTPEARARARLMTSVLVAAVGAATVLAVLTVVLVLLGRPGLTLDDPTARHSALGGEPTALLFWFARLTAAVIALAVLAARRARPAERWLRGGLAALVVVVTLGGLAVLLAAITETLLGPSAAGSAVTGWVVAAVVVAALWQPVAARSERLAERLLYGTRATPAGVLAEVSELTRRTAADPSGLDRVPEAVGRALGARAVRLTTHREGMSDRTSRWRTPGSGVGEPDASFPVRHEGQEIGALAVDAEALAGGDERRRLVAEVADGLGGVLAAHRLEIELERQLRAAVGHAEQIAASRRRLVSEMDSERRGIERNLHDGAQHHLVSLRLTLGLVEHLASAGRLEGARERLTLLLEQLDTAETVLADTASGVSSATLRRLGPVETLRADLAEAEPPVVVDGEGVGRHDEAVEAAVYFCTLEAVNNARKHAGGAAISVRLREADGVLRAVVRDEGPGFTPGSAGPGRGMRNLATRLSTVKGRVDVESVARRRDDGPGGGAAAGRGAGAGPGPPPVEVPAAPAPAPAAVPERAAVVARRAAVVPELGPPRRGPDPAGPRPAPPPLLPPSGSPLYDAAVDLLRAVLARTPDRHAAARPLAALLARHGAPWRVGVAAPDRADAAAVAEALAAVHPRTGTVVDLSARAAAGPLAPDDVVDELVLLTRDDAGSWVPGWLAERPTVDVRIVPPDERAADHTDPDGAGPADRTVRVALPGRRGARDRPRARRRGPRARLPPPRGALPGARGARRDRGGRAGRPRGLGPAGPLRRRAGADRRRPGARRGGARGGAAHRADGAAGGAPRRRRPPARRVRHVPDGPAGPARRRRPRLGRRRGPRGARPLAAPRRAPPRGPGRAGGGGGARRRLRGPGQRARTRSSTLTTSPEVISRPRTACCCSASSWAGSPPWSRAITSCTAASRRCQSSGADAVEAASHSSRTSKPVAARSACRASSVGKLLLESSSEGSRRATSTSRPRRPPGRSTRCSSASRARFSSVVSRTPRHQAASTESSASGRCSLQAATAGRPKRRSDAAAACGIGSASTTGPLQRSAYSRISHAVGPPSPEPASRKRSSPDSSRPSASQARSAGLPEPRHAAGMAWSSPSSATAASVQAATVSNSASRAGSAPAARSSSMSAPCSSTRHLHPVPGDRIRTGPRPAPRRAGDPPPP